MSTTHVMPRRFGDAVTAADANPRRWLVPAAIQQGITARSGLGSPAAVPSVEVTPGDSVADAPFDYKRIRLRDARDAGHGSGNSRNGSIA